MNRLFGLILVVVFFLIIDFYFFQAVKTLTRGLTENTRRIINFIYWSIPVISLAMTLAAFTLFPEYLSAKTRNLMAAGVFLIYLSKILGSVFLLIGDIVNLIRYWGQKVIEKPDSPQPATLTRSEFLATGALAVGGLNLGTMVFGIISGAHDYRVRKVPLYIKNLPKKFDGMTIAQLSDIHSGSFYNKTAVNGGVDMLLAEKPDVVFFTGDLVNNEAKELEDYFNTFKRVKAPLGVYSTLGNHDYGDYMSWESEAAKRKNLETLIQGHKLMGWDILMDENRSLKVDGESIGIVGIQNWGMGGFIKKGDLKKALQNTEDQPVKLLLSHDPSHWRAQVAGHQPDINVAFAGHTHGMQYGVEIGDFKWSPVQYRYKEWAGLYKEADQQLYVNRGFGFIGYPGRVGILPEISIFTLKSA